MQFLALVGHSGVSWAVLEAPCDNSDSLEVAARGCKKALLAEGYITPKPTMIIVFVQEGEGKIRRSRYRIGTDK